MTSEQVYLARCWDKCKDAWVTQAVFLCCQEAVEYAYHHAQTSVRCNRPLEWWRVEKHYLTPCSGMHVVWGAHEVSTGECCK